MKTIIYYFTGTGNSLAVAKKIAAALGDCELVPIASLQKTNGDIVPQADRVGIVCPVYFSGLPVMVDSFAQRLDLSAFAIHLFGCYVRGFRSIVGTPATRWHSQEAAETAGWMPGSW